MPVSSWSTSASSNTTVGGVAIAPAMARANVDDALRAIMAEAKAGFVEGLSVKSYGALGNGIADDTAAIAAALLAAQTTEYQEKTVIFPPGDYRVTQIDLRDCNFLTLHATGTVNITGTDGTKVWIMGDDRFDDLGHVETFTQNFRMTGGPWLIAPLAGQTYARGLLLQNFKDSEFHNLSVSGTFTPTGGTGDRKGVELELSFNNQFYNCTFAYPGAPIGADKSYALWLGTDNVNNNRFFGFRVGGGPGAATASTIGVRVNGSGNSFFGADISAVHTCFELNNARGALFSNVYHEAVSKVCTITFASTGCVFQPAYVDIAANGTAYDLSGAQTVGFSIVGGNHKFNVTGTTGIAKGSNTYGLTYQPGIDTANPPATASTGTDNGSGGSAVFNDYQLTAARIAFPDTPVASSNATTLDCYLESTPTLGIKVGSTAQTVTTSAVATKTGRVVTVTGTVTMAGAVSGTGVVTITGLPNAATNVASAFPSLSAVTYTGTPSLETSASSTELGLYQTTEAGTRSQLTETSLSATSSIRFSLTYTATA